MSSMAWFMSAGASPPAVVVVVVAAAEPPEALLARSRVTRSSDDSRRSSRLSAMMGLSKSCSGAAETCLPWSADGHTSFSESEAAGWFVGRKDDVELEPVGCGLAGLAAAAGGMPSVLSTSSISGRMLLSWSATSAMSCGGQGQAVKEGQEAV